MKGIEEDLEWCAPNIRFAESMWNEGGLVVREKPELLKEGCKAKP